MTACDLGELPSFSAPPGFQVILKDGLIVTVLTLATFKAAAAVFNRYLFPEFVVPGHAQRTRWVKGRPARGWGGEAVAFLRPGSWQAFSFGATFALAWLPLVLLVCEITGTFAAWTRERASQGSLHLLVFGLTVAVPWSLASALLAELLPPRERSLSSASSPLS